LIYEIEYLVSVVEEDLPNLSKPEALGIRYSIEQKLTVNPLEFGKPLRYSLKGARSLRVGDYRVIFVIEPPRKILVVKISHRKEVYGGH
jgi:mRNA interferase RelE/StbE